MRLSLLFLALISPSIAANDVQSESSTIVISRAEYADQLHGFWLGQSIANWTGLVTEMDKIGNIGEIKTGAFYTRDDWGQPDQPSIWGEGAPSDLSPTIDFVFRGPTEVWGADDDTDIEYMYQFLLNQHKATRLSAEQIRQGWLTHIKHEEENFLWVSNQRALELMIEGTLPPHTSDPKVNKHTEMIDAQLTTEIFGLYVPTRPDVAVRLADLPIRTTATGEAELIAKFYVRLHGLASHVDKSAPLHPQLMAMADTARSELPDASSTAAMYDFVLSQYRSGASWEAARDAVYQRYQVDQADGYTITAKNLYCNGCFAAGINFAAGMVSYFYGEGDLKQTIKIGALAGWDSDNPTATWGGLLGFIMGKAAIEKAFGREFSEQFNIHRTRQNFPNNGIDNFPSMAEAGLKIVDRVVVQELDGRINGATDEWHIPSSVGKRYIFKSQD